MNVACLIDAQLAAHFYSRFATLVHLQKLVGILQTEAQKKSCQPFLFHASQQNQHSGLIKHNDHHVMLLFENQPNLQTTNILMITGPQQ
jgi:hypothetical protein